MSSNEVWARCGDCGTELKQSDKQCPTCGSTKKAHNVEASVKIGLSVSSGVKHKRKGKGMLSISEMGHFLNRTLWHDQAALTNSLRPRL